MSGCAKPVGVLLVDDHVIWRQGLRSMLDGTRFHVVGEAGCAAEALRATRETRPDLVLLDIRMEGGDGFSALREIKRAAPATVVLMLSVYDNPGFVAKSLTEGASGYLLKSVTRAELLDTLERAAAGESLVSADALRKAMLRSNRPADEEGLPIPLSAREVEVLTLLTDGLSNREIAAVLVVSESTVKTHVEHIVQKLGVSDRVQAAVWAARHGMTATSG